MGFDEVKAEDAERAEAAIKDITMPEGGEDDALLLNRWVVIAEYVGSEQAKDIVVAATDTMAAYDVEGVLRGAIRQVWEDDEEEEEV